MSIKNYYSKHVVDSDEDGFGNQSHSLHAPFDPGLTDIEMHEKLKNDCDSVKLDKPIEVFSQLTYAICAAKIRCAIGEHIAAQRKKEKPDFTQIRLIEKAIMSVFDGIEDVVEIEITETVPPQEDTAP